MFDLIMGLQRDSSFDIIINHFDLIRVIFEIDLVRSRRSTVKLSTVKLSLESSCSFSKREPAALNSIN